MQQQCKRTSLFLLGCMGVRLSIAFAAWKWQTTSSPNLQYLIYAALLLTAGWMIIWGFRLRSTGMEAADADQKEGEIWWDDSRPIHAVLYLMFAIAACNNVPYAWSFLLLDAIFGLVQWIRHRMC